MAHATSDPKWISEQLRFLARQFNRAMTPDALDAYANSIARYPTDSVRRVIRRCSEECRTFPPLVEILNRLEDDSPRTGSVDTNASDRRDIASRAQNYLERGVPFALVKSPYQDLLMPIPFSPAQRENWHRVCNRLPEWSHSETANGPLPPCLACHSQPTIQDCPNSQFIACTKAIVGHAPSGFIQPSPLFPPL